MKRRVLFAVCIAAVMYGLAAQEAQLSIGPEFGIGVFKVNNDFAFSQSGQAFLCKEEFSAFSLAPGFSLSIRRFLDSDSPVAMGFVFRDSALFVTNYRQNGRATVNGSSEGISETYGPSDDFFISAMSFDLGPSSRYILSQRLQFYADIGFNFTMMDSEIEGDTRNYLGLGLFSDLALQVNLKKPLYLEFGLNAIINILSNQKGTYVMNNQKIDFEDTGRWDLVSLAPYIHIGWRIDLKKLWGFSYKVEIVRERESSEN
jgi:hypothetical protein